MVLAFISPPRCECKYSRAARVCLVSPVIAGACAITVSAVIEKRDRIGISMESVAIKKGQTRERAPEMRDMGTLRCEGCGEEFIIFHDPALANRENAARQAHWLEKVLAEEHEREQKHPDRIQLPD